MIVSTATFSFLTNLFTSVGDKLKFSPFKSCFFIPLLSIVSHNLLYEIEPLYVFFLLSGKKSLPFASFLNNTLTCIQSQSFYFVYFCVFSPFRTIHLCVFLILIKSTSLCIIISTGKQKTERKQLFGK